jgi:hypothetical protein
VKSNFRSDAMPLMRGTGLDASEHAAAGMAASTGIPFR